MIKSDDYKVGGKKVITNIDYDVYENLMDVIEEMNVVRTPGTKKITVSLVLRSLITEYLKNVDEQK